MNEQKIVLLCSDGDSTRAIYNALRRAFGSVTVIMEEPIPRMQMARRRAKKVGYLKVAGQIIFVALAVPILGRSGRMRIREIESEHALDKSWDAAETIRITSVNSDEGRTRLREIGPSVVIVNGTRIIGKETLSAVDAPFINTHAGITPLYRGVHGGYWALAEGRPEMVGTTVHMVDKGIDTGKVIKQAVFSVTQSDNFATYPYLHTAAGIPILIETVRKILAGALDANSEPSLLESKLRYHPTICEYLYYRLWKGVR